jgi:two-component system, cell cycle sensor histidine kinase and response regulator CckA
VQQVVFNLVINARDAMPEGGTIEVTSGSELIEQPRAVAGGKLEPGNWAFLRVRDAGTGIEPAILERIFDLFFTTKPVGEGTGLGLAMVLRIAQQSAGGVVVESKPGAGSSFTVYLTRS